jgi:hypothetical protein
MNGYAAGSGAAFLVSIRRAPARRAFFDGDFDIVGARLVGDKHLKMQLTSAGGEPIEAIAFGYIGDADEDTLSRSGARIQLAYRLEISEHRGAERAQLNCQHLQLPKKQDKNCISQGDFSA